MLFNVRGPWMCCVLYLIQIKQSILYFDSDIVSFYLTSTSARRCDVIYFWHRYSRRSRHLLKAFKHTSVQINAIIWPELRSNSHPYSVVNGHDYIHVLIPARSGLHQCTGEKKGFNQKFIQDFTLEKFISVLILIFSFIHVLHFKKKFFFFK